MDIYQIRQANFHRLIVERYGGSQTVFTDATGMSPSYVSQLLRQHRTIGEKTARKIEMYSGLEPGALDAVSAETEIIAPMVVEKAHPLHHSPRTQTLLDRIAELVAVTILQAPLPAAPAVNHSLTAQTAPGVATSDHFLDARKMVDTPASGVGEKY